MRMGQSWNKSPCEGFFLSKSIVLQATCCEPLMDQNSLVKQLGAGACHSGESVGYSVPTDLAGACY